MDVITMASIVQHGLIQRDRIFSVSVLLPDKPGELVRVAKTIADAQGNVIKLEHNQFVSTNRNAAVELRVTMEAFGTEHKHEILQALENNGANWNGLIFQRKGKPVHPNTFSHHLRRLYDRNGFPEEYHLHTMRHFFATYLLEHGTSKQVAADLLGHADTAFLERTYCHPQDICKEEAAGLFDSLLAPAEEEYCAAPDE